MFNMKAHQAGGGAYEPPNRDEDGPEQICSRVMTMTRVVVIIMVVIQFQFLWVNIQTSLLKLDVMIM